MLKDKVKPIGMVLMALAFVASTALTALALNHSGTIAADETWRKVDNPHVITADVFVQNNGTRPTLTLEPGVVVQFNVGTSLHIGWSFHGKLVADGTAVQPITFTSVPQASPSPGDWDEIDFNVDPSGSLCNHCVIEYGGGGIRNANVALVSGVGVSITNSEITDSLRYGVSIADGASRLAAFSDNTVSDNGWHPVNIWANYLGDLGTGNSYTGNNPNRIQVNGDTVTETQTWRDQGIPYEAMGDIGIQHVLNPQVTIAPGATFLFNFNTGLGVGSGAAGGLIADGTAAQPITFSSVFDDESFGVPGDWDGIRYEPFTDDTSTICDHCIIEYGGGASGGLGGNVRVNGAFPTITNSTIQYSETYGVNVLDNSGFTAFTNNDVSDNGLNPIQIWGEYVGTLGASNVFANTVQSMLPATNKFEEIRVVGDTVVTSATWLDQGVAYLIAGTIHVQGATPPFPVLTLDPGVTLRFNPNTGLIIGQSFVGNLVAEGTPRDPITMTSWDTQNPTPGDWGGIELANNATASSIDHATIAYGGGNNLANLYIHNACTGCTNASVSRSVISHSMRHGIYVSSGVDPDLSRLRLFENVDAGIFTTANGTDPTIAESTFDRNTYGVYATNSANPTIGGTATLGNNFYNSRICGVQNTTAAITVNATNNWWGDASGPSGDGAGSGDAVCGNVNFASVLSTETPWVEIVDFWTSDLADTKTKNFSPGNSIRYHLAFGYDNGKDSDSTIKMRGKLKGNTTVPDTWTHKLNKNINNSFMFHYQTWDKTIPSDAVIENLKAKMKVTVNGAKDNASTKVNIVP